MLGEPDTATMVSPAHLRRAEELCSLRLAFEHDRRPGGLRQRTGDARFAVSNRLEGDVRLAHAVLRRAQPSDFPTPSDLAPEQQIVYRAAARGYLALFGDEAAQVADETAVDAWGADLVLDTGPIRLVGGAGIAVETPTHREVRILRLSAPGFGRAALDDVDLHLAAAHTQRWAPDGTLRVVAADLLELSVAEVELELASARPAARTFIAERVERIRALVAEASASKGIDCTTCGFVARCRAHRAP